MSRAPKDRRDRAQQPDPERQPAVADVALEPRLVRLNKFLADHGVASRRRCDEMIAGGQITVDGETVRELGLKIDPQRQAVEVDGYVLGRSARRRYYLLNKPSGVVCTNEARETRPRAVDLITDPFKGRIYTVGRLDEESRGVILLTNDGEFAHQVMHPRFGIQKRYLVKIRGQIDDATLNKIRDGVHLSEGRTAGARILVERRGREHSLLTIELTEGMNREIRRVFAHFGYKVLELKRVSIGALTDRGLKVGRWREVLASEIKALLAREEPRPERRTGARPRRPGARSGPGYRPGGGARHKSNAGPRHRPDSPQRRTAAPRKAPRR